MRVCIKSGYFATKPESWGISCLRALQKSAEQNPAGFDIVHDTSNADVLLFTDTGGVSELLFWLRNRTFRQHSGKSFVYCEDDDPSGLLPGLYPSIPLSHFERTWHQTCPYMGEGLDDRASPMPFPENPAMLFSFAGSCETHPIRQKIRDIFGANGDQIFSAGRSVVQKAFDTGDSATLERLKRRYHDMSEASQFVLCPRGNGASTIRLFEVMSMGRSPVIISDEWVPPPGPVWSDFSIRISEDDVSDIPRIIKGFEPRWREMGTLARENWEQWFAPRVWFQRSVESCLRLKSEAPADARRNQFRRLLAGMVRTDNLRKLWHDMKKGLKSIGVQPLLN